MDVLQQSLHEETMLITVEDLPDEILEFIFSILPPYKDLQNCMIVCKRWSRCAQNVFRKTSLKLNKAVAEFNILWKNYTYTDIVPTLTKRFCHAACVLRNNMYVFGGCTTNNTVFNDLWIFDLSKRLWVRPLATGTYPVPKGCTSMVTYKNFLIVFGGRTYPSRSNDHQNSTMFNEIHFYCVNTHKWMLINAFNSPPPMAGHSAFIKDDEMIVFGGKVMPTAQNYQTTCSNDVWVFDIISSYWRKQPTTKPRPQPRYGQSLITLDEDRVMILGGLQTVPNTFACSDCWILTMSGPTWTWKEIAVKNKEWASDNIWCNPACRVGDKVVSLNRSRYSWNAAKPLVTSLVRMSSLNRSENAPISVRIEQSLQRPLDRDQNINGRRGVLPRQPIARQLPVVNIGNNEPIAGPSNDQVRKDNNINKNASPGSNHITGPILNNSNNRIDLNKNDSITKKIKIKDGIKGMKILRQLQEANKYRMAAFACESSLNDVPNENDLINQRHIAHLENRFGPNIQAPYNQQNRQPVVKKVKRYTMTMHVLDISTVINGNYMNYVSWLCPRLGEMDGAPEETLMYTLVKGNGELIMFGGVHNEIEFVSFNHVQNLYPDSFHIITPPRDII